MDNSKRSYNTYEENQRIREAARVSKKEGTVGPIPTTVNLNNSKRTYLTYEEEQRIKESVKVYNKELARNEEEEIKGWMIIFELPDVIRKLLLRKLKSLTFIYDIILVFLFYKLTLYLEKVFNFKGNVYDTLFNNPYNPSSAEIQGSIFYLIIFGLPVLYTIIQVIRFSIFSIKDIFILFKRRKYTKQEILINNVEDNNNLKEEQEEIIINTCKEKKEFKEDIDLFKISENEIYNSKNEYKNYDIIKSIENNKNYDPYLYEVIESILELEEVTTSFIQRRFKVGYSRASRILDQIEEQGIISKYEGSKPRIVLITKEEWEELKDKI